MGSASPLVLVVEDDFLVRAVAVAHLEESGFSILEAQTADEAMVILRDDRSIAAVFSDVQMPGSMDGICSRPVACPQVSQRQSAFNLGKVGPRQVCEIRFIAKPYSLEVYRLQFLGHRVERYRRPSDGLKLLLTERAAGLMKPCRSARARSVL